MISDAVKVYHSEVTGRQKERHNPRQAKRKHCEDFIILRACSGDGVTKEAMEKNNFRKGSEECRQAL